jgi:hypothetical protein
MLEAFLERGVQRRIQELLDMAECPEAGPDFSHCVHIQRIERADGRGVEVDRAAVVAEKDGAGDDAGAVLEEDHRAGIRVQAGGGVAESAVARGEIA